MCFLMMYMQLHVFDELIVSAAAVFGGMLFKEQ